MPIDVSRLYIEKVIIHQIIKQTTSEQKELPHYSEIESPLDDEIRLFLKDKVIKTIGGSKSYEVLFEDKSNSPIPEIVRGLLSNTGVPDFILLSKKIASHLNSIQNRRNPGGLVTLIMGNIQSRRVVGILKLEREEGARLKQTQIEGRPTYDIHHLKDLILTEKTKLFKIGLFFNGGLEDFGCEGKVCDNQLPYASTKEVAEFFLTTFLGCRLAGDPKVETRDFFSASQEFFRGKIEDPIVQTKYNLHLLSYISNEGRTINSRQFASLNLHTDHRQPYINYLEEKKVRTGDIVRDISLIENRIKEMMLEFENGIKIIGNRDGFDQKVSLQNMDDGRTKAEIISKLKNIKTK
jgi:hypothetical protein